MSAGLRGIFSRNALLCALVFGIAELLVLFTRTTWIGLLGYTAEWANAGLYIASPLIAGAATFVTRHYFSAEAVVISGARSSLGSRRTVATAWARIFIVATLAHAIVLLIALTVSITFGPSGTLTWQPFVYALMPIAMACAIGVTLAALVPHVWSSVLAVLFTYAVWYIAVVMNTFLPVNTGGATISLADVDYRATTLWTMFAAALIVTAAFLFVAVLAVRWQTFGRSITALVALTAVAIVSGTVVGSLVDSGRFTPTASVAFACEGSAPRVCLTSAHSTRLTATATGVASAARLLSDAGIDVSGMVLREEVSQSTPGDEGTLVLSFGQLNGIGVGKADYARSLLRPANCADYTSTTPTPALERLLTASKLVGEWLTARITDSAPTLRDDQVRQLYEGLQQCDVEESVLNGVERP